MQSPFNSPLELSLRLLLTLSLYNQPQSRDKLLFLDFLTTYGKKFGLSLTNLHGNNPFYSSELAARRSQVFEALKQLVIKSLILPQPDKKGFSYLIQAEGRALCQNFTSSYALAYLKNAQAVRIYSADKTETQLLQLILSKAN